jgi:penicillin-binding protein activator
LHENYTDMKKILVSAASVCSLLFTQCAQHTVTRVDPGKQIDLSGRWNDTDSKLVAQEMTKDVLGRPWRETFFNKTNKKPTVIVGVVTNKSSEHIEADVFIKDIEREFVNSGMVRLVQNSEFREKVRQERADQGQYASPETAKKWGKELGADFMMFGTINSVTDVYNKKKVMFYKVNLELTDMETNEIVWIGDKEIKKFVEN